MTEVRNVPEPATRKELIERTWRHSQATKDAYEGEDSWLAAYRTDVAWLLDQLSACDEALRGH